MRNRLSREESRETLEEEILSRYRSLQDHEISGKKSGEIVTEADIQSERRLALELTELLSGSTVIGEEGYAKNPSIINRFEDEKPIWVLDPLDGTRNFSEGGSCFCVIVALVCQKVTQAGWIYNPLKKTMYSAQLGKGVWRNAKPIDSSPTRIFSHMSGSVGKLRHQNIVSRYGMQGPDRPAHLVRYRCIGMEYVDLVLGNLDFAEYGSLKPWDHAAGALLLHESGGLGAYVDTKQEYVPGPTQAMRFIATRTAKNWPEINQFLAA